MTSADWPFPFAAPGRPKARQLPPKTAYRWPFTDMTALDDSVIEPRHVRAPIAGAEFRSRVGAYADDVGLVRVDHPALAHELQEILYVYPHARTLVVLIGEQNKAAMQSRYLPSANHELYACEERLFECGHRTVKLVESLGGAGLTTTIGWPQEVSQRWADKIWPLSHKLAAQAAGLGVVGTSRNFLHRRFGAYCLIDTVLTNLEFEDEAYGVADTWNPCLECNLCVASCPTDAIKADGEFDFFACYNHTYRDSIPGFLDLVRDLGDGRPRRFARRWSDAEIAALWQSMAFKVEYRCFNCVATCPAEIHAAFHADTAVRREYLQNTLKPLTHVRREVDEQFVIDTPSARDTLGIPPGEWRTPPDATRPTSRGTRLVQLHRIRTSNVDSMMRNLAHYFRPEEAAGLAFTCQMELSGEGGGEWVITIGDRRCQVRPGRSEHADLVVHCDARLFLRVHRGEASAPWQVLIRRIRLRGNRRLFLTFRRLFPIPTGESFVHRLAWQARRWWRRRRQAS